MKFGNYQQQAANLDQTLDSHPDDLYQQSIQGHSSVGLTRRVRNTSDMHEVENDLQRNSLGSSLPKTPLRVQIEQNQATHATLEL